MQKAQIEADVMSHDRCILGEGGQVGDNIQQARRAPYLDITDACQPGDKLRDVPSGVDQRGPFRLHAVTLELYRTNFDNNIPVRAKAGCLNINSYD